SILVRLRGDLERAFNDLSAAARIPRTDDPRRETLLAEAVQRMDPRHVKDQLDLLGRAAGESARASAPALPTDNLGAPFVLPDSAAKLGRWLPNLGFPSDPKAPPDEVTRAVWKQFKHDAQPLREVVQVIRREY